MADEDKSWAPGEAVTMDAADAPAELTVVHPAAGKATETARALLDAAVDLDYDESVVGFSDGAFLVPADVAEHADIPEDDGEADKSTAKRERRLGGADDGGDEKPTERSSRADIDAYGHAHGVDTTQASTKAEALALLG